MSLSRPLLSLIDLIDGAESYGYAGSAMHWRPNYPAPSMRIAPTLPALRYYHPADVTVIRNPDSGVIIGYQVEDRA